MYKCRNDHIGTQIFSQSQKILHDGLAIHAVMRGQFGIKAQKILLSGTYNG